MANSLQDQLLKAGLVSQAQLNSSKKKDHRSKKRSGKKKPASDARAAADRSRREKEERDRALNAAREEKLKDQALRAQVRELVLANALPLDGADVPYNVVRNGRIRRIYVTAAQRDQLAAGKLAVVTAKGRHHLITLDVADRVHGIMPSYFVFRTAADDGAGDEEDDAYAEYKVPDDLMW